MVQYERKDKKHRIGVIFVRKARKLFSGSLGGFNKAQVVEYIEELNRKSKMASEQAEFQISHLSAELADYEMKAAEYEETKEKLVSVTEENQLLKDDVSNQKEIIDRLTEANEGLAQKLSELEKDYYTYKEKAERFDEDKNSPGGILERAKAEAVRAVAIAKAEADEILRAANETAKKNAEAILAESEKQVSENIRKVKYLYKRRDELLSAFEKVKEAAGGFYDNIASTLTKNDEE